MRHTVESTIAVLQNAGAPDPVPEWPFALQALGREWKLDFAFVDYLVGWEIEGLTGGKGGRHQRPAGYTEDCRKYAAAALLGWTLIRTPQRMVASGEAVLWLLAALGLGEMPVKRPGRRPGLRQGRSGPAGRGGSR